MHILYISDIKTSSSVFRSQVHTLCNNHSKKHRITLLTRGNIQDLDNLSCQYKVIFYENIKGWHIKFFNKITAYTKNYQHLLESVNLIHCRGHAGSAFGLHLRDKYKLKIPLIADLRGAVVEEFKNTKNLRGMLMASASHRLEKYIFNNADFYFFVSKNMQKHYNQQYPNSKMKSAIFPTIVDSQLFYSSEKFRQDVRKELQLTNKFVYVYAGGVSYWQKLDSILARFNQVSQSNNQLFLLLLVTNKEHVKNLMISQNIINQNIKILTLPYQKVGKYLNAADAGLLIRDKSIINYVASPTKINEYLACGLNIVNKLEDIGYPERNSTEDYCYRSLDDILMEQEKIYKQLL